MNERDPAEPTCPEAPADSRSGTLLSPAASSSGAAATASPFDSTSQRSAIPATPPPSSHAVTVSPFDSASQRSAIPVTPPPSSHAVTVSPLDSVSQRSAIPVTPASLPHVDAVSPLDSASQRSASPVSPVSPASPSHAATAVSAATVRIGDVALAAGVSTATVSRALRGLPHVAAATRQRVCDIAAQLDYRPNLSAARLAAGTTDTIAVAVPDPATWFNATIVGALGRETAAAGYDLLLSGVADSEEKRRFIELNGVRSGRSDAVVLIDVALDEAEADEFAAQGGRAVSVGYRTSSLSSVMVDNVAVGSTATRVLIEQGHRRIGLLSLYSSQARNSALNFAIPSQRAQGYAQAHAAAGLIPDPALTVSTSICTAEACRAARSLLDSADRPTALFAMSDNQAFGAMLAARELGLRIPADLSLVGTDDHDQSGLVGLTTVRQHVTRQGALAAELVLQMLQASDELPRHLLVPTELIVRDSTGPPPG